jgi:hypothetical protein
VCFPCAQSANKDTDPAARYAGVFDAVRRILRREGFLAFFKGMKVRGACLRKHAVCRAT